MIIKSCYIDGFGCFNDRTFTFGESKAALIIGKNEAGKTTLFSFLRGQLSGYYGFKRKENHYHPLNGGKHGGRFSVIFKNEEFQVFRYLKEKDLTIFPESLLAYELKNLLESIQIEDYRALFAFDLDELKAISLLEKEDLTERLFSSGLTGANNIISEGIQELENISLSIFKPRSNAKLQLAYEVYLSESEKLAAAEAELIKFESQALNIEETKIKLEEVRNLKVVLEASLINLEKDKIKIDLVTKYLDIASELSRFEDRVYPTADDLSLENHLFLKGSDFSIRLKELKEKIIFQDELARKMLLSENLFTKFNELEQSKEGQQNLLARYKYLEYYKGCYSLFCLSIGVLLIFAPSDMFAIVSSILISLIFLYSRFQVFKKLKEQNKESSQHAQNELKINNEISDLIKELGNKDLKNSIDAKNFLNNLERLNERNLINQEEINRIEKECEVLSLELKALYSKYTVSNHLEFKNLVELFRDYEKAKNQRDEFLRVAEVQGFDLTKELSKQSETRVGDTNDNDKIKKELESLKIKEELLLKEIAIYSVRFESLAKSHEIEDLKQSVANTMEVCNELYTQWQVAIIAEKALRIAMAEMYSSRYSEVLNLASNYLKFITLDDYQAVTLGADAAELLVANTNGRHCQLDTLSRGTLEQVYLAMRLALSNLYGKKYGELPLIFDDILVNFDDRRARATMQVLKEISHTHQIILFTCHEWVRALFTEVMDSEGQVITI